MAVRVEVPYRRSFVLNKNPQEVFDYLWDVRRSVPENFPGLEHFDEVQKNTYRWSFEKIGYSGYEFGIRLVTAFSSTDSNKIEVRPVAESGASDFTGSWSLSPSGGGTEIVFDAKFVVELPIPFFVKAVAVPLAQSEIKKLFDRYVDRVAKNFG